MCFIEPIKVQLQNEVTLDHVLLPQFMYFWLTSPLCFDSVYYVGPDGWKKLSGDDVGELHYHYNPVKETIVEQEMADAPSAST